MYRDDDAIGAPATPTLAVPREPDELFHKQGTAKKLSE